MWIVLVFFLAGVTALGAVALFLISLVLLALRRLEPGPLFANRLELGLVGCSLLAAVIGSVLLITRPVDTVRSVHVSVSPTGERTETVLSETRRTFYEENGPRVIPLYTWPIAFCFLPFAFTRWRGRPLVESAAAFLLVALGPAGMSGGLFFAPSAFFMLAAGLTGFVYIFAPGAFLMKILKWTGIVLGSLVGLLVLTIVARYIIGGAMWNRSRWNYDVPVESITIPTDQTSIARGEHIATIRLCRHCHADSLGGQSDSFATRAPGSITLWYAPNLTTGAGGVGATNTDEDWVRAIRHGVGHDGRGLVLMPARIFYHLSDEDLGALIAYLKSLPPVDNEMPPTDLETYDRVMLAPGNLPPDLVPDVTVIDHDGPRPVAPEPGVTVEYGAYLAITCTLCHGSNFNGQTSTGGGPEYLKNLTPGGELRFWSEEQFVATLRTGVTPSGHYFGMMPWKYFGQMTDDELKAVWLYLQSLPALPSGE